MQSLIPRRSFFAIIPAYARGVKLGFGKYLGELEPGIRLNVPFYHQVHKVDMRNQIYNLPDQHIISKDNVSLTVNGSVQFKCVNATKLFMNIDQPIESVITRAALTLRERVSLCDVDEILQNREDLAQDIKQDLDKLGQEWGVDVSLVQIKDIVLENDMKRAMALTAEATRVAKSKIIQAKADVETAKCYNEAAQIYKENPITLRLREFQLWQTVAKEPGNNFFVIPSEVLNKK